MSHNLKQQVNSRPKVSIVMPVKDGEKFLPQALDSVLNQTLKDWELLVVNDGSLDKTGSILDSYAKKDERIQVITNKSSQGIGACLNVAISLTLGEFVARMDGDDVMLADRLEQQVRYLSGHPEIVACGTQVAMIDAGGDVFAYKHFPVDPSKLREVIMWMVPMQHPAMMIRGDVYRNVLYDESFSTAEDVEMMMQLLQYGEFGNVDEVLFQYRKADTSNGYHNVKRTFWLTMLGRYRGIVRFGYRPSLKGWVLSLAQLLVVPVLPAKWVVRLYELKRFVWKKMVWTGRYLGILPAPQVASR